MSSHYKVAIDDDVRAIRGRSVITEIILDRDPRVSDTSDNWWGIPHHYHGIAPCGAVARDDAGQLVQGCPFWDRLTLVHGRWLCGLHAAGDLTRLVWPVERGEQLAMWGAVPA